MNITNINFNGAVQTRHRSCTAGRDLRRRRERHPPNADVIDVTKSATLSGNASPLQTPRRTPAIQRGGGSSSVRIRPPRSLVCKVEDTHSDSRSPTYRNIDPDCINHVV
ncbi:uncharacterized protein LOC132952415 [Metopolophium dirhodum]|uniref:uncharacterized protein LOC132952415 n=1 Tax=Metopolophium dirhodum TaxID=44670 RepID=UPI00299016B0|nr:uncharacterized protein LOC132952415 [Metopolophium dirhodum]